MHEPVVTLRSARGRYGGAVRLGTPEAQAQAHAGLVAARLDQAVCDALNAGDLPDTERLRLGILLLSNGTPEHTPRADSEAPDDRR